MKNKARLRLQADANQQQRLAALQTEFARACNVLAPMVQSTRCWNRVALHHMAYKELRQRFPELGSQMACNAIYSVSRASRQIYQHPQSPFNLARLGDRGLPLLQFAATAPVYFDRHTLSLKTGEASLFTLDGRMRFRLDLRPADERRFREQRLREIVLTREGAAYWLTFTFGAGEDIGRPAAKAAVATLDDDWPQYLVIHDLPPPAAVGANPSFHRVSTT